MNHNLAVDYRRWQTGESPYAATGFDGCESCEQDAIDTLCVVDFGADASFVVCVACGADAFNAAALAGGGCTVRAFIPDGVTEPLSWVAPR